MQFTGMMVEDTEEKEEDDQGNEKKITKEGKNPTITMSCCHPQHARRMEPF